MEGKIDFSQQVDSAETRNSLMRLAVALFTGKIITHSGSEAMDALIDHGFESIDSSLAMLQTHNTVGKVIE